MRIIDRYVVREVFWPFCIGLAIFTFILIIPVLIQEAEELVAKGTPALVVAHLMWLLVPQALGLTIPMSLLLGLLVAFGRLSSDREFVAMQACGISLLRLLRPVAVLSVIAWAATSYVLLVAVPSANQSYREIIFTVLASRAEGEVKPRVFFEGLPDLVLYVREVPATGGWNDVFMAYNRPGQPQSIYLARHGRVLINREKKTVEVVLQGGTRHTADTAGKYQVFGFDRQLLSVSSESLFPRDGPAKGEREMTVTELRARIAQFEKEGTPTHNPRMEIHKKFSIPVACLVFGLIGLALGVSNRRGSKLASFVVGIGVIFIYYVLMWLGLSMAKGAMVSPWLAMWLPNIGLGALGGLLFLWRDRAADRPIGLTLPPFMTGTWRRRARPAAGGRRRSLATRLSRLRLPSPGLLDRYVAGIYAKVFAIAFVGLTGLFYIAQFIDLSDKVFKGTSTWSELSSYFWYATPQYVYYVIPLSVLVAALVTIGVLTKNSELIVMKACGISLYRVAFPVLVAALAAGAVLFLLEESILGPSNRRAEAIRHVMRGGSPQTFDVLNRRWVVGSHGEIYHFNYFDPRKRQLLGLSIFRFEGAMRALASRTYAERAMYVGARAGAPADAWHLEQGWMRTFDKDGDTREYRPFATAQIPIEPASYFATQQPEPKYMSYTQLRRYIERLRTSGLDVVEQQVALERKISFPFVTLIMTLIAVPFAVTTGRHGAMYGIGVGIVLAISYWVAMSVFGAIGSGGLVAPALAAWAPNLLFGAGAAYLLLTVRT